MIPQSFIQDLLNRVDVVEVVGSRVQLKKAGANFLGLCPFHTEKSPSFTVSPVKQFYHCFGCGKNGSAITFLMEYVGLSFVEAVEELAQSVGMTVPQEERVSSRQSAEVRARSLALTEVMEAASRHYQKALRTSQVAIAYLKARGVTGEVALRFGLGYATGERDGLKKAYADYARPELVEAGLVIEKTDGQSSFAGEHARYDRFRDRIMFPIRNTRGQVIAFGGRVLDKSEPKYLNSPETPLFQKGNELYGLFEARQAIRNAGYVLVVEGYMDVVALSQMGIGHVVATLGTACTPMHVQKLFRQVDRVVFSFDGDRAGRSAAKRALESSLPYVTDTKSVAFLFLPPEHDPDSYVRQYGAQAFEDQVKKAMPLSEFLMREIVADNDMGTLEGRARAQHSAKPWLQALSASALRLQIMRKLAEITQTPEDELMAYLNVKKAQSVRAKVPERASRPQVVGLERQVMRLLLMYPRFASRLTQEQRQDIESYSADNGVLFHSIVDVIDELGSQTSYVALVEALRSIGVNCEQLVQETLDREYEDDVAFLEMQGALRQIRLRLIATEMKRIAELKMPTAQDLQRYNGLRKEQLQLQQQMTGEPQK